MEEMMDDTLEMQDEEEIEEEADAEVDKVLFELTNGKLGEAGTVGTELPVCIYPSAGINCELTDLPDNASTGGGRDRENDGTISAATEWFIERITSLTFCTCINLFFKKLLVSAYQLPRATSDLVGNVRLEVGPVFFSVFHPKLKVQTPFQDAKCWPLGPLRKEYGRLR
jgi:hypothetical protein